MKKIAVAQIIDTGRIICASLGGLTLGMGFILRSELLEVVGIGFLILWLLLIFCDYRRLKRESPTGKVDWRDL